MKYRIFSALAIAVFIITIVLISRPASSGDNLKNDFRLASTTTTFEGTLLVKEGDGHILVRSDDLHQRRIKVNKQSTAITRNGKPAAFEDLQIRDHVRVSYNSKRVVVEIDANGS